MVFEDDGIREAAKRCAWLIPTALGCTLCTLLNGQDISSSLVLASIQMAAAVRPLEPNGPAPVGALRQLAPADPFTPSQRWARYVKRTYSPPRLGVLAIEIAVDHALREPACWDQGAQSYARRYERALERRVIRNTAELGAGLLTGEDTRYLRSRSVRPPGRVWNAVRRAFLARMPDGTERPAYTRFVAAAAAEASTAHWVGQRVQPGWMAQSLAWGALDQIETNLLDEFGPDLRRVGSRMWKRVRGLPETIVPPPAPKP
jgi:hypothetical protein